MSLADVLRAFSAALSASAEMLDATDRQRQPPAKLRCKVCNRHLDVQGLRDGTVFHPAVVDCPLAGYILVSRCERTP